jgi:hypothetical protein
VRVFQAVQGRRLAQTMLGPIDSFEKLMSKAIELGQCRAMLDSFRAFIVHPSHVDIQLIIGKIPHDELIGVHQNQDGIVVDRILRISQDVFHPMSDAHGLVEVHVVDIWFHFGEVGARSIRCTTDRCTNTAQHLIGSRCRIYCFFT